MPWIRVADVAILRGSSAYWLNELSPVSRTAPPSSLSSPYLSNAIDITNQTAVSMPAALQNISTF
jgi:hypothetical protein